jgi:hypothetical protein
MMTDVSEFAASPGFTVRVRPKHLNVPVSSAVERAALLVEAESA